MPTISTPTAFELVKTYFHLDNNTAIEAINVTDDFWSKIEERTNLHEGWLVTNFQMDGDWTTAEIHPHGDEFILLISGAMNLILQYPDREEVIEMRPHKVAIVPKGVWHTAKVFEPSLGLFITPGKGTETRPV